MSKRKPRPYQRKGERHPFLVRGTFYHHLRLGVRITFERAYNLPDDMNYVVICNGVKLCHTFGETAEEAEKVFAEMERLHHEIESSADEAGTEGEPVDR